MANIRKSRKYFVLLNIHNINCVKLCVNFMIMKNVINFRNIHKICHFFQEKRFSMNETTMFFLDSCLGIENICILRQLLIFFMKFHIFCSLIEFTFSFCWKQDAQWHMESESSHQLKEAEKGNCELKSS